MKKIIFLCDLCNKETDHDHRDSYYPDDEHNLRNNGMALISPGSTWQRVSLKNGSTIDICNSCCRLIARLIDLKPTIPFEIKTCLGDTRIKVSGNLKTVNENDIRRTLGLLFNYSSPEIIIYDHEDE